LPTKSGFCILCLTFLLIYVSINSMSNISSTQASKQLPQQSRSSLLDKTVLYFEYNERITKVRARLQKNSRSKK